MGVGLLALLGLGVIAVGVVAVIFLLMNDR
jgi:hypothetical protein